MVNREEVCNGDRKRRKYVLREKGNEKFYFFFSFDDDEIRACAPSEFCRSGKRYFPESKMV
jgi:hypothetical protein